jgi:hypothetical protein
LDRLLNNRVAASQIEDALPRQQIQIAVAIGIPQIGAFSPDVYLVEANDRLNACKAGVDVLPVQGILFSLSPFHELNNRECHGALLELHRNPKRKQTDCDFGVDFFRLWHGRGKFSLP